MLSPITLCPNSLAGHEMYFAAQPSQPDLLPLPSLLSGKYLHILQDPAKMSPSLWNAPNSLRQHESLLLHVLQAECLVSFTIHHITSSSSFYTSISPTRGELLQGKGCLIQSASPAPRPVLATISCGCPMRAQWHRMLKCLSQRYPAS